MCKALKFLILVLREIEHNIPTILRWVIMIIFPWVAVGYIALMVTECHKGIKVFILVVISIFITLGIWFTAHDYLIRDLKEDIQIKNDMIFEMSRELERNEAIIKDLRTTPNSYIILNQIEKRSCIPRRGVFK